METCTVILTTILVISSVTLLFLLHRNRKQKHETFKRMGLPGPEPHWFYGNLKELGITTNQQRLTLSKWSKQYGKKYGYFEGPTPILVSSDLDFLKEIFIKNFSKFHGRKFFHVQPDPAQNKVCSMFLSYGHRWKRMRTIVNPSFSSAKLKYVSSMMNKKSSMLLELLDKEAAKGEAIDVHQIFARLTMEVIGEAAFGVEMDCQKNPDEPILKACQEIAARPTIIFTPLAPLPELRFQAFSVLMFISRFVKMAEDRILDEIGKIAENRKQAPKRDPPDLMQLMLDAEANENEQLTIALDTEDQTTEQKISFNEITSLEMTKKKLTIDELKVQGRLFFIAGNESTSATLAFTAYNLATNPDKQELLFQEIDRNVTIDEVLTYQKVHSLMYLDMVLRETLRMYPVGALLVNRRCMEECTIDGLHVLKDTVIHADVWSIHYDPDIWGPTDPEKFEPDRFSLDRKKALHPLAWIPFGAGPRNCVGLRFALLEAKIILVKMIKRFKIEQCDDTEVPLKLYENPQIGPKGGVKVKLTHRK